jgi:peptide/nickel transport system permease protein
MAGTSSVSPPAQSAGWRQWLLSPEPHSRLQARLGRAYLGWRAFTKNPLAVLGLAIVALLVLVAIFADFIAP